MRHLIALVTISLSIAVFAQDAPKLTEPDYADSFFFLQTDNSLKPLERKSVAVSTKIHALGYGGAEVLYDIQDEHSSLRTSASALPPIIVKLENSNTDPANVVSMYPLTVAKGQRQLQMMRSHIFSGAKNTMQGKLIALSFEKYGQASVKITPASPLAPGEYAIVVAQSAPTQAVMAFCFGVDAAP